jgi:hypothetical protein
MTMKIIVTPIVHSVVRTPVNVKGIHSLQTCRYRSLFRDSIKRLWAVVPKPNMMEATNLLLLFGQEEEFTNDDSAATRPHNYGV